MLDFYHHHIIKVQAQIYLVLGRLCRILYRCEPVQIDGIIHNFHLFPFNYLFDLEIIYKYNIAYFTKFLFFFLFNKKKLNYGKILIFYIYNYDLLINSITYLQLILIKRIKLNNTVLKAAFPVPTLSRHQVRSELKLQNGAKIISVSHVKYSRTSKFQHKI